MFNGWRAAADVARLAIVTTGGFDITPVIDVFTRELWERLAPAAVIDRYNALAPAARVKVSGHLGVPPPGAQLCMSDVAGSPCSVVITPLQYKEKRGTEDNGFRGVDQLTSIAMYLDGGTFGHITDCGYGKISIREECKKLVALMVLSPPVPVPAAAAIDVAPADDDGGVAEVEDAAEGDAASPWQSARNIGDAILQIRSRVVDIMADPAEIAEETTHLIDTETKRREEKNRLRAARIAAGGARAGGGGSGGGGGGGDPMAIAVAVLLRSLDEEFGAYEVYMTGRVAKETKDIYGDPVHYVRPRGVPANPGALPGNPLRYAHWLQRGVLDAERPDLCLKDKFPILFAIARSVLAMAATSLKIERVNSAAAIIDTKLRRSMLPETLSGYVLAGQYKKEFLKGREIAGDFLREGKWQL